MNSLYSITLWSFLLLMLLSIESCYSFKGISIPAEVNTYFVADFSRIARNAPADLEIKFAEGLRDRVRTESRLNYADTNPDVEFKGVIKRFETKAEAPQEGSIVTQNKLTLEVEIEYISNLNEEDGWKRSFSEFEFFSAEANLSDVQDDLINTLVNRLTEEIFNASFTNW